MGNTELLMWFKLVSSIIRLVCWRENLGCGRRNRERLKSDKLVGDYGNNSVEKWAQHWWKGRTEAWHQQDGRIGILYYHPPTLIFHDHPQMRIPLYLYGSPGIQQKHYSNWIFREKKTNKQTLDLNYTLDQVTQTYIGHSTQHQKHAHSSQM